MESSQQNNQPKFTTVFSQVAIHTKKTNKSKEKYSYIQMHINPLSRDTCTIHKTLPASLDTDRAGGYKQVCQLYDHCFCQMNFGEFRSL